MSFGPPAILGWIYHTDIGGLKKRKINKLRQIYYIKLLIFDLFLNSSQKLVKPQLKLHNPTLDATFWVCKLIGN